MGGTVSQPLAAVVTLKAQHFQRGRASCGCYSQQATARVVEQSEPRDTPPLALTQVPP